MANTKVDTNSSIGGELGNNGFSVPGESTPVMRKTYRQLCQHYVTNNNSSIAPTVTRYANGAGGVDPLNFASDYNLAFDQGFVNIPFTNTNMAMDRSDWDAIQLQAARLRIAKCGFSIKEILCSQQQANSVGSTTTINNQFTQMPKIQLVIDDDHILSQIGTIFNPGTNTLSACQSIFVAPGTANKGYVQSYSAGALPKVWWIQPCTAGTTAANADLTFNLLKEAHNKFISTGMEYNYEWTNTEGRWMGPLELGNSISNLTDETTVNNNFYTTGGSNSLTAALMENLATDVFLPMNNVPVSHFIRVPPLYSFVGPVTVLLMLMIEYHMEIEWIPGKYLTTRYTVGSDTSVLPTNMLPYPLYRRTMLAYSEVNPPASTLRQANEPPRKQPRLDPHGRQGFVKRTGDDTDGKRRTTVIVEDLEEDDN